MQCSANSACLHHVLHTICIYACQRVPKSLWQPIASDRPCTVWADKCLFCSGVWGGSFGDNVPQVGGGGGKVGCVPRGWITLGRVWSSWLHCLVGVKNGQFAVHVDATALNMFCAAVLQCCGFTCVARLGTKHRPPRKRGSAGPSPVIHSAESSQEPWVGSPPICICSWDMLPFSQRAIRIQIEPGFENSNPRYCQCNC